MKRLLDIVVSVVGLLVTLPFMSAICIAIWLQDWHSPFYVPSRVGLKGRPYRMFKLRSMVVRADRNKVDSTSNNDPRITAVGRFVRRFKLDEIPQLWNVLNGDMSLVGPRPNVDRETNLYTSEERRLLDVQPGITDISSIVFADEGAVLEGKPDPDLAYNQLIRPWKSRLGLLYVDRSSAYLDIRLILLTLQTLINRDAALENVSQLVRALDGGEELARVARRQGPLLAAPPPGATEVVVTRGLV